jgi:hypothetical protein
LSVSDIKYFIDLENAYDKVPRNTWALQKHKVSSKYITLIKDMYDNVVINVRTSDGATNDFPINIGLHQGSALSPYLFVLMMDEVTRDIQGDIPWCMLFGDLFFNVISAYAPQIGLNESIKRQFWEQLDALVSSVPISEKLFIGNLNGHVGSTRVGFDGVHEGFWV